MWATNLKILGIVLGTLALYTLIANGIPQVESEVPQELSFTGEVSAAELVAAGEELYAGAGGCTACHGLGTRAPNLLTDAGGQGAIGARCSQRVEGESCKEYLYRSMIEPNAFVVEGFQPIMPDIRRTLSGVQIWAMIAYLQSVGGEVTVTGDDVAAAQSGGEDEASDAGAGAMIVATTDPLELLGEMQCLACHLLGDEGAQVGPPLDAVGSRLTSDQIRESILDPNAAFAEGYEQFGGMMPANFGQRLTAEQLEVIVSHLGSQR
jgi:mono/diheme cytochrome c family protein